MQFYQGEINMDYFLARLFMQPLCLIFFFGFVHQKENKKKGLLCYIWLAHYIIYPLWEQFKSVAKTRKNVA